MDRQGPGKSQRNLRSGNKIQILILTFLSTLCLGSDCLGPPIGESNNWSQGVIVFLELLEMLLFTVCEFRFLPGSCVRKSNNFAL